MRYNTTLQLNQKALCWTLIYSYYEQFKQIIVSCKRKIYTLQKHEQIVILMINQIYLRHDFDIGVEALSEWLLIPKILQSVFTQTTFPHSTCLQSVLQQYLSLGGIYHLSDVAFQSSTKSNWWLFLRIAESDTCFANFE